MRKSRSATYNTWLAMHHRCKHRKIYKDKGINVCERWKSFENFLEDMGERPINMTIDRIDNADGYYKGNCRWASPTTQMRNRDISKLTLNDAVNLCVDRIAKAVYGELAEKYKIAQITAMYIVSGKLWKEAYPIAFSEVYLSTTY